MERQTRAGCKCTGPLTHICGGDGGAGGGGEEAALGANKQTKPRYKIFGKTFSFLLAASVQSHRNIWRRFLVQTVKYTSQAWKSQPIT